MYGDNNNVLVANTPLEAFAAALLCQPVKEGWCCNAVRALAGRGPVVAGIVLQVPDSFSSGGGGGTPQYVCVSLGSGTRCVGYERLTIPVEMDFFLRDGHAEVMARRGFVAFLQDAAVFLAGGESREHPFVERCNFIYGASEGEDVERKTLWRCFRLKAGVTVHLVCTEYPCGAMSVWRKGGGHVLLSTPSGRSLFSPTAEGFVREKENGLFASCAFADASNVIVTYGHVLASHRCHPADKLLMVGRVKPGKGHQNLCMSCSDKLLKWHCLGIQGRRRARLFPTPIRLTGVWLPETDTVCAAGDDSCKLNSLEEARRALNDRMHLFGTVIRFSDRSETLKKAVCALSDTAGVYPVKFHTFAPSSLHSMLVNVDSFAATGEGERDNGGGCGKGDSCWSRGVWLGVAAGGARDIFSTARSKRCRECDTGEEGSHGLKWDSSGAAVVNTKDGLSRGVTRQSVERLLQQLLSLRPFFLDDEKYEHGNNNLLLGRIAARFPLSRLWMAQQHFRVMSYFLRQPQPQQQQQQQRWCTCLKGYFSVFKGFDKESFDDIIFSSFPVPVFLVSAECLEKHDVVRAGGSTHYWLQRCREARVVAARDVSTATACLPLLWVEKGDAALQK